MRYLRRVKPGDFTQNFNTFADFAPNKKVFLPIVEHKLGKGNFLACAYEIVPHGKKYGGKLHQCDIYSQIASLGSYYNCGNDAEMDSMSKQYLQAPLHMQLFASLWVPFHGKSHCLVENLR